MLLLRYILRNHFVPFVFTNVMLMGIFLLQFLMKTAERLIGKGLETWVIIQLIVYNLAWMVVLIVPMSVLIATLMAFGGMSQSNEITIMKATGISLPRMIFGPFVAAIVICIGLIYFNNDVLPDANHQAKLLMFDISQKKPTLSLRPGVISQEVNNFAILARGIDEKTNRLSDLTLYDYSTPDKINIVTAKAGKIYFSPDLSKLLIDLENGEIHESQVSGTTYYRKLYFTKHRMAVNADQFSFQQSNDSHRGDRELSAQAMLRYTDSLKQICAGYEETLEEEIGGVFFGKATYTNLSTPSVQTATLDERYHRVLTQLYNDKNAIITSSVHVDDISKEIDKYMVEVHKKYALPVACLVFILLGAPLGVMTRKGGFGMAGSISLFFFIVYWAFLIGGEKLADRGLLTPFWGMWAANVIMGALGVFLLYRSVKETVTLNFAFLRRFVPKNWRSPEEESQ